MAGSIGGYLQKNRKKYKHLFPLYSTMPYRKGVTTIQLTPSTRDKLKDLGKKGESYEQIILKLLKAAKK